MNTEPFLKWYIKLFLNTIVIYICLNNLTHNIYKSTHPVVTRVRGHWLIFKMVCPCKTPYSPSFHSGALVDVTLVFQEASPEEQLHEHAQTVRPPALPAGQKRECRRPAPPVEKVRRSTWCLLATAQRGTKMVVFLHKFFEMHVAFLYEIQLGILHNDIMVYTQSSLCSGVYVDNFNVEILYNYVVLIVETKRTEAC